MKATRSIAVHGGRWTGAVVAGALLAACGGAGTSDDAHVAPRDATDAPRVAPDAAPALDATLDAPGDDTPVALDVPTPPDVAVARDVAVAHDAAATVYASALAHLFALTPAEQHAVFTTHGTLGIEGCNRVSYTQLPGSPLVFIGRTLPGPGCAGSSWSLTRNSVIAGPVLHETSLALDTAPGLHASGDTITTGYDATAVLFGQHVWVAFECAGPGITSAGSCVGPLDGSGQHVDPTGLTVVVSGNAPGVDPGYTHSASVPKLLVHRGHLYLYWSSVRIRSSDGVWADIRTRGVELAVSGNHVYAVGASGPIAADGAPEVWGLGSDARSNAVADTFMFVSDGTYVYATAGLGGGACLTPLVASVGCYRLAIARSTDPLGVHAFNALDAAHRIADDVLPANPIQYPRLWNRPDGTVALFASILPMPHSGTTVLHDGTKLELPPSGSLYTFELPSGGTGCTAAQAAPNWGVRDEACHASCGGVGGTTSSFEACSLGGHTDVGVAYDVPFCCR